MNDDFALSMISSKALRESGHAKRAWHKHDLESRVGMSREREERSLYIGSRGGAIVLFSAAFSCSVARILLCLPSIRWYLDTSREAVGKEISVAQARLSRQSGHAKGTRRALASYKE